MLCCLLFVLYLLPSQLTKAKRAAAHPQLNTKLSSVGACCKPLRTGSLCSGQLSMAGQGGHLASNGKHTCSGTLLNGVGISHTALNIVSAFYI